MKIYPIPILKDNYAYAFWGEHFAAVVDPSEHDPVLSFFEQHQKKVTHILNTHHHWDHVGGNLAIKAATGAKIYGGDDRIPGLDEKICDGEAFYLGDMKIGVIAIPGHTIGHTAFYIEQHKALFSGDTLFSLGCGRLFEGTPEQMFTSLGKLKRLPADTQVYCGHEYTEQNARFALSVDADNRSLKNYSDQVREKRQKGIATVPSTLRDELVMNPFLRATDVDTFAELRRRKDKF
jgi:hydroxyacylglutathione hydrolase